MWKSQQRHRRDEKWLAGGQGRWKLIRLFAGIGHDGSMRFIGEVERGAACGCLCPECRSPLIAKQGTEKDWHFAHEAGQERPECEAGAANMLRRLVLEHLQARPVLVLPAHAEVVRVRSPLRHLSENIAWPSLEVVSAQWTEKPTRSGTAGLLSLADGSRVQLLVEVGDAASRAQQRADGSCAAVVFWCTLPSVLDLRKREDALRHVDRLGKFVWIKHPDAQRVEVAARERLAAVAKIDEEQVQRDRLARAQESFHAGSSADWTAGYGRSGSHEGSRQLSGVKEARDRKAESLEQSKIWAPDRKPNTAFVFYRMSENSAWVIYTLMDGTSAIAPWPSAQDGWDEELPPSVGRPDPVLAVYRVADLVAAMMYLGPRSIGMRATSDPSEFDSCRG